MWTKRCVCLSLLSFLIISFFSHALGEQTIVLNIILNYEAKGELFVIMTNEGDFLIRMEDLKHIGLKEPQGAVKKINTEDYISIRSMQGVKFILNEETLSLEITASPDLLGKEVIDFTSLRPSNVYYPKDSSVFLNYRIDYDTDLDSAQTTEVTNQLGVRHGDLLFLSDSTYTKDNEADKFVRLMSNITYDRRDLMQRIVIGDFFASSGVLGSSLNLGGISYSKAYIINPYFIKNPQIGFSGAVSLPTDVYVYLDGIQIRHERFSPGEFELSNISAREGAGLLEVVLRDPFGNEQRITESYYLTNAILKMGLHDYSYNIGFLREDFGEESSNYDDLIFSAFHRYGVNDQLTVNFMGEA
ncbi:MAG TPA: fimbria/pilus outer membrane usher protein, partial [Candidatus Brocadiales bacterium]|nr:fimbria/pilus outer membrane usher protein [Candidatus Brocadiales bacterium]